MSAVERVRETARLMRERADAAIRDSEGASRWAVTGDGHHATYCVGTTGTAAWGIGADLTYPDAEHIASLDPEVARRIADLLDAIASENDSPEGSRLAFLDFIDAPAIAAASLADLYLGVEQ